MKLLLDTNVFLWLIQQEPIPQRVLSELENTDNQIFLSLVSPSELQIKLSAGKLILASPINAIVSAELNRSALTLIAVTMAHIDALSRLPLHHRDPFDRLLIAQAMHEGMTIVTADRMFPNYSVAVLWD